MPCCTCVRGVKNRPWDDNRAPTLPRAYALGLDPASQFNSSRQMLSLSTRRLSVPARDAGGICLLLKLPRSGERSGAPSGPIAKSNIKIRRTCDPDHIGCPPLILNRVQFETRS